MPPGDNSARTITPDRLDNCKPYGINCGRLAMNDYRASDPRLAWASNHVALSKMLTANSIEIFRGTWTDPRLDND
jgi:hypothetical protein